MDTVFAAKYIIYKSTIQFQYVFTNWGSSGNLNQNFRVVHRREDIGGNAR